MAFNFHARKWNRAKINRNQNSEITNLNNEISDLENQISNLTKPSAKIVNFTQGGPYSIVFGASGYNFGIDVQNTGYVIIQNITLTVNMTLSDGESITIPIPELESSDGFFWRM